MIVRVLTTYHTQYTWDRSICIFLFNRTTLQVFVTYLTGALYVHPLWFYKHQHDNRVRSTQNAFSLPFATIFVNCAPSGEMHNNYCTPHIIKENFENFLIHRCNYILLSQVYCAWQVVKTLTIILITQYFNSKWFLRKLVQHSLPIIHQLPIMIWRNMSSPSFVFVVHSYSGHTIIIEFSCFHERGRCGNEVVSKQIRAWIRARWVSGLW